MISPPFWRGQPDFAMNSDEFEPDLKWNIQPIYRRLCDRRACPFQDGAYGVQLKLSLPAAIPRWKKRYFSGGFAWQPQPVPRSQAGYDFSQAANAT